MESKHTVARAGVSMGSVPTLLLKELVKARESVADKYGYWLISIYRVEFISSSSYMNVAMGMYEYPILKIEDIQSTIIKLFKYSDMLMDRKSRHVIRYDREYFEVYEGNNDSSIHS